MKRSKWMAVMVLAMFAGAGVAYGNGDAAHPVVKRKPPKFLGVKKCKSCHEKDPIGNQYGWWLGDAHSKAFETLASEKAKKWGAEAGVENPQTADQCVKCHMTAHDVPPERLSRKFDPDLGVQCESCHGAGSRFWKKKKMIDHDAAVAAGLTVQTEAVCTTCHNDESPAWDPERYSLPDGSKAGFDYKQALEQIAHPVPEGYDPMAEDEAE